MQVVSPAGQGIQHFQKDFQQIEAWSTVNPLAESHDNFGLHKEIEDQPRPQAPADGIITDKLSQNTKASHWTLKILNSVLFNSSSGL